MKKPLKAIIITVIVIAAIAGAIAAAYFVNRSKKVAKVVNLDWYAMTNYYGDEISSSGSVMSDESQVVYISSSDKILSVDVAEGDTVSKGDVLFTMEVETQDLTGKELAIRGQEIQLNRAKNQLEILKKTSPVPDASKVKEKNITKNVKINKYTALSDIDIDNDGSDDIKADEIVKVDYFESNGTTLITTEYHSALNKDKYDNAVSSSYIKLPADYELGKPGDASPNVKTTVSASTSHSMEEDSYLAATEFYDEDGKLLGTVKYDYFGKITDDYQLPVGFTAQQLAEKIATTEYEIRTKDLALRKAYNEFETMKRADTNGKVVATMDGVVTKLQDYNNLSEHSAYLIVSASNEYFIQGAIGEFDLDTVHVGDSCMISNWENGTSTEATIVSIDDFAGGGGGYWSRGNENVSSYGFRAVLADLDTCDIGDYVDITINGSAAEDNGFYIEKSLVRKDAEGNYVMIMDENERLKKVYVACGKTVWGSYVQILGGAISTDNYIAFPYGDGAIEGAKCEIVDSLYTY